MNKYLRNGLIGLFLLGTTISGLACSTKEKDPQTRLTELVSSANRAKVENYTSDHEHPFEYDGWGGAARKIKKSIDDANEHYENDQTQLPWIKERIDPLWMDAYVEELCPRDSLKGLDKKMFVEKVEAYKSPDYQLKPSYHWVTYSIVDKNGKRSPSKRINLRGRDYTFKDFFGE